MAALSGRAGEPWNSLTERVLRRRREEGVNRIRRNLAEYLEFRRSLVAVVDSATSSPIIARESERQRGQAALVPILSERSN